MWLKAFWIFVALLPFSFALNPTSSIDLQISRILILPVLLLWLIESLKKRNLLIDNRIRALFLLVFIAICCLSIFWSLEQGRALRKALFILNFAPLFFVSFAATESKANTVFLMKLLVWSGFFLAILGLVLFFSQFIFGIDPTLNFISSFVTPFFLGTTFSSVVESYPSWLVNIAGKDFIRAFGVFPDPHLFSLYLNMLLPLIFFLHRQRPQRAYYFIFATILLASLFSFSRAAYISLFGLLFFGLFTSNLGCFLRKNPLASLLAVVLLSAMFLVPNPLSERLTSSFDPSEGSNSGRIEMWKKSFETTKKYPLGGVGIGNFSRHILPSADYRDPIYAHNLFLDFSSETGIFNSLILFLLLFSPIALFFKKPSPLRKSLAASLIIFLGHSIFETPFFSVHLLPLVLILLGTNSDE